MDGLQVLVSTMNQKDGNFLKKMNIHSDTIVINQCNENKIDTYMQGNHKIVMYSLQERGVGLSRNTALMRASKEISLLADDDVQYYDDYEKQVLAAFESNPGADIIIFELENKGKKKSYSITKKINVGWFNYQRYGAAHFAFRTDSIRKANCYFSLLFGGGAPYSCGEDSIFLHDCLKAGLKIVALPICIGEITDSESTWFKGYSKKYFLDRGRLFYELNGKLAPIVALRFACKQYKKAEQPVSKIFFWMLDGIKLQKNR